MKSTLTLSFILLLLPQLGNAIGNDDNGGKGEWKLLQKSIGITAMHMQLLYNDRVVIFDRTDFGLSNISLPNGKCRHGDDRVVKDDCTAHSVEYNVLGNEVRPLMVKTNVWCSSAIVAPDGRLIQTGGFNAGDHHIRMFRPCSNCDWEELGPALLQRRWYASNHILPEDGSAIIIGGRRQFNYEFYPKSPGKDSLIKFPFLTQTYDYGEENNLYPFVHLNVDGNLFIYANNRSILFNYRKNTVVKTYPVMPGGHPRNYPSTGSSVLLPLRNSVEAEVLICGGAPRGSFPLVNKTGTKTFVKALSTCGRMKITDASPRWVMETMPLARTMGDMILLPNGHVLIINGAGAGTAGWEFGRNPVLNPVLYRPDSTVGSTRFEVQNPSSIPRLYHSSAILLRDGRVLVGGSNPHEGYNFTALYPTELSLEAFSPWYLNPKLSDQRVNITRVIAAVKRPGNQLAYGEKIVVQFSVSSTFTSNERVAVTIVAPSFATHSFSMNQRLLVLGSDTPRKVASVDGSTYMVEVATPNSAFLAPPGYYMLFVVQNDIPSKGRWIKIG